MSTEINRMPENPPAAGAPLLLRGMHFYNRLLHVFLGFSLVIASLLTSAAL